MFPPTMFLLFSNSTSLAAIQGQSSATQFDAIFWAFTVTISTVIAAYFGAVYKPRAKIIAGMLSFTAGVLIALVSYDLIGAALDTGGLSPTFWGMGIGLLTYFIANRLFANAGDKNGHSFENGSSSNSLVAAKALVIGALIDGIPESASIGIGLMESKVISISMIVGIFLAHIPKGLVSGTGLSRSGFTNKRIVLLWLFVTAVCTFSSWLAFMLLRESGPFVQAMLMSIAGGGLFAMTLQTVVPEGFEGSHDWISILGCIGFLVIFTLSHLGGKPGLI